MTETESPAATVMVAFIVTILFISLLRPVAKLIGLIDIPGGRKSHQGEIPIIGGIAMFIGMFAAFTLLPQDSFAWPAILAASTILVIVGVVDDQVPLPTSVRFLSQIVVLILMVYGAGLSLGSIGDPFGTGEVSMGRFTLLFTGLVTLSMINAYNLVDGVDGLAGSLALMTLLAIGVVSGYNHPMMLVALAIAAAILGFLVFNFKMPWNRELRVFMGDAGSTLLGFAVVWVTLSISSGPERLISPVHCLWFASMPIYDLFTCFIRRISKGKSPLAPGRDHFHHTLRRGGFGVRRTLGILVLLQATYATIGVIGHKTGTPDFVMFSLWTILGISQHFVIRLIARNHRVYQRLRRARVSAT